MPTKTKIIILNGPNLNLLGVREPEIYGNVTFEMHLEVLKEKYPNVTLEYFQSNTEGEIINRIHETGFSYEGIVLNAGAFSHYSYAIMDAISAVTSPVVEVHISNIHARKEEFRHQSVLTAKCVGIISGFGLLGYQLAIESIINR